MSDVEIAARAIRSVLLVSQDDALAAAREVIAALRKPTSVEVRERLLCERYGENASTAGRPNRANP